MSEPSTTKLRPDKVSIVRLTLVRQTPAFAFVPLLLSVPPPRSSVAQLNWEGLQTPDSSTPRLQKLLDLLHHLPPLPPSRPLPPLSTSCCSRFASSPQPAARTLPPVAPPLCSVLHAGTLAFQGPPSSSLPLTLATSPSHRTKSARLPQTEPGPVADDNARVDRTWCQARTGLHVQFLPNASGHRRRRAR